MIPKDPELRKKWLHKISRKNFDPTTGHRVCSEHFEGGKKTYTNNIPTIVPKSIKPTKFKERTTNNSKGMKRSFPSSDDDETAECPPPQLSTEEILSQEVEMLKT